MFVDWERWNRQMYRYPNNFCYFKTEFHLTIYLHAMLVTKGRGWDGKLCNQLQTPHGCYILPWPGTGSAATNAESWNTKSIFTLCFVVRIILEPYQFEMLLAWGCLVHHTAANSVCSFRSWLSQHIEILIFCLLASITTIYALFCKIWNTNIYYCPYCFLFLNLIFNNTNNILTLKITHTLHLPSQQTK